MPVMKALNIDGTTYTTTGEVTVTQTLSSGTAIGSINVDGASTTLYAPGDELPTVTSSDNGKVLMVVSGSWAAAAISSANGVSF